MRLSDLSYEEAKGKYYKRVKRIAEIRSDGKAYWKESSMEVDQYPSNRDEWKECDIKGIISNYPIYRKSKASGQIIKFTGLKEGTVVVRGNKGTSAEVGKYKDTWVKHTDTSIWDELTETELIPLEEPELGTKEYLEYWKDINKKLDVYIHVSYKNTDGTEYDRLNYTSPKGMTVCALDTWGRTGDLEDKAFSLTDEICPKITEYLDKYISGVDAIKEKESSVCEEHQPTNEIKENEMKETTKKQEEVAAAVKTIQDIFCNESKVEEVKTDLKKRKKITAILYGRDGAYNDTYYFDNKKQAKKLMQIPTNIGCTLVLHKETGTITTDIPLVETTTN